MFLAIKKLNSVQEVKENWQQIKKKERDNKNSQQDIFANVPRSLPALKRAQKNYRYSRYLWFWLVQD